MAGRLSTGALAARGAGNPGALAAYIAQRTRNGSTVLGLAGAGGGEEFGGQDTSTCPSCGYSGPSSTFSDSSVKGEKPELRTPAPDTGYVRNGAATEVRSNVSAPGLANPGVNGIGLASPRYPVTTADDILVRPRQGGGAEIRHRRGGTLIGEIINDGTWKAMYGGRALKPHAHQRGALAELLSTWNTGTVSMDHPGEGTQLQPPPQQTQLMQQYGIPAISALATPSTGYASGPRTTGMASDDDSDDDSGGMSPKAAAVYRKLVAKGWDKAKARKFAANADRFTGGGSD